MHKERPEVSDTKRRQQVLREASAAVRAREARLAQDDPALPSDDDHRTPPLARPELLGLEPEAAGAGPQPPTLPISSDIPKVKIVIF